MERRCQQGVMIHYLQSGKLSTRAIDRVKVDKHIQWTAPAGVAGVIMTGEAAVSETRVASAVKEDVS